jgi:hypothetical protein
MPSAVLVSKPERKMSKLQTVEIKPRQTVEGEQFDIVEIGTGYMVRAGIGTYKTAREIAEQIDALRVEFGDEYLGVDQ